MKAILFSVVIVLSSLTLAQADGAFPTHPDAALTPGSLCDKPNSKRYPEGIAYCTRRVDSDLKREIMQTYDARLGFQITRMARAEFKIDHYIPLCMGGSNNENNLWPQHQSVYAITDPLEQAACDKMAKGVLRQAEAIELIKRAKADLKAAPGLFQYIQRL